MNTLVRKLERNPSQNIVILSIIISAVITIVVWLLMRPVEEALKAISPYGVMELEFAWTVAKINQIFNAWGTELIAQELYVTLLDFIFLIVYSTFFASVTLLLTRRILSGRIQLVGFYMTIIPLIAALFDAIENINLILMLFNLIPLYPLDGEKIAQYFFPPSWANFLDQIRPYSSIILIVVFFGLPYLGLNVVGWIMGPAMDVLLGLLIL